MTQRPHIDADALNAYLDDAVPDAERLSIASHLAGCAHCRRELAELRTTVSLLHGLPQYQPRRSFQLGAEHAQRTRRLSVRLLPVIRPLAMAAVVLFAVVTGVAYFQDDPSTDFDRELEPQMAAPAEHTDTQQGTTPTPQTSLMTEATTEADDADILGGAALDQEASTANQEGAAPRAAVEESRAMNE
ncbi:MAG: zf-HC2 domain-containing protein, partial [Chloroflexota bacterium]|nr:zf-HC2 domain-containing protein [Chloroflexota bacterium]